MEKIFTDEGAFRASTKITFKEKIQLLFVKKRYKIDAFDRSILVYKILKGKVFVLSFSKL